MLTLLVKQAITHDLSDRVLRRVDKFLAWLTSPPQAPRVGLDFNVGPVEAKVRRHEMLELNITNEQKIPVTVNPVTATGRPAQLDGPIVVTVQSGDGTVETVDDRTFKAVSGDNPGDTVYLVSADADLGAGVVTVSDIVTLHVAGALAESLGLTAGAVEPK